MHIVFIMIFLFSFGFSLFFPLTNGSVILTPAAPPISPLYLCLGSGAAEGRRPTPLPAAVCGLEAASPTPPHCPQAYSEGDVREERETPSRFPGGAGNLAPASSAQVVRGSWGCSGPMSTLPTHQPASPGKRGVFCACLPPPAPAQGSSVLERGMWADNPGI